VGGIPGPVRYAAISFDGLGTDEVPFFAVLRAEAENPLAGDLVLFRGIYPNDADKEPIAELPLRTVLRLSSTKPNLAELGRIFRFGNGCDGYQWGDTQGSDGNYGAEVLASLVILGYARRTGASVANGLGGSWPEVEVTAAGVRALLLSETLTEKRRELDSFRILAPVATLNIDPGVSLSFCARTGAVLGIDPSNIPPDLRIDSMPARIDVAELAAAYPDETVGERKYELSDVGYWTIDGRHQDPDEDFREELCSARFSP
jgi:hypothetical protein